MASNGLRSESTTLPTVRQDSAIDDDTDDERKISLSSGIESGIGTDDNSECECGSSSCATTPCRLWAINRPTFQAIMMKTGIAKHQECVNYLKSVPMLAPGGTTMLTDADLHRVADLLEEVHFKAGDYIVRQGRVGGTFYIVTKGQARMTSTIPASILKPTPQEKFLRTLAAGDFFGEQTLVSDDPHPASVVVASPDGVTCLTLGREAYQQLLIGSQHDADRPATSGNDATDRLAAEFDALSLSDLQVVATLGIGGFGRVELVRSTSDASRTYALKVMKKQHIVETKQQTHIINERQIMMAANNSFIVNLYKTFKDNKYLYMLMEPCLGGEVWSLLRDRGYFEDGEARFYAACTMEALEYLHRRGIIFRDLKPENLLLDSRGYAKLVDFGFAKKIGIGRKTWTFCGTPEYVAPEIVLNKGHDMAVDLWSLGIFVYELLSGVPPFASSDPMRTYNMILKGVDAIDMPRHFSKHATQLIKKLCREVPAERLGTGRAGMRDVRRARWFDGFDFAAMRDGTLPPPIVPRVEHAVDTSNFDNFAPDSDPPPADDASGWDIDF